jgi:uncharacterized protein (DUF927 family)
MTSIELDKAVAALRKRCPLVEEMIADLIVCEIDGVTGDFEKTMEVIATVDQINIYQRATKLGAIFGADL